MLVIVALVDFVILTALAFVCNLASVHVLAGCCLALAALLGWHVAAGGLSWTAATTDETVTALFSSASGTVLVPIVLMMGTAAAVVRRVGRRNESQAYVLVATIGGLLSLGLATCYGFGRAGDPGGVTWVYATYAAAALVLAGRVREPIFVTDAQVAGETRALGWIGTLALLAALVQGFVYGGIVAGLTLPWMVALLVHAALATGLSVAITGDAEGRAAIVRTILHQSALVTSILAAAGLVVAVAFVAPAPLLARMLVLAGVWLVLSWRSESPPLFAGFQAALSGVVVYGVATVLARQAWYVTSPRPWLDPWMLQAHAIALGVLGLGWTGLRVGFAPGGIDPREARRGSPRSIACSILPGRRGIASCGACWSGCSSC